MKKYLKFRILKLYLLMYEGSDGYHHHHAVFLLISSMIFLILMLFFIELSYHLQSLLSKRFLAISIIFCFLFSVNLFFKYFFEHHFFINIIILCINSIITAVSTIIPISLLNKIMIKAYLALVFYLVILVFYLIKYFVKNIIRYICGTKLVMLLNILNCFLGLSLLYFIHPFNSINNIANRDPQLINLCDFTKCIFIYILVIICICYIDIALLIFCKYYKYCKRTKFVDRHKHYLNA